MPLSSARSNLALPLKYSSEDASDGLHVDVNDHRFTQRAWLPETGSKCVFCAASAAENVLWLKRTQYVLYRTETPCRINQFLLVIKN